MKRPFPLWLAAVVPATLAAHGLAYALSGRSLGDAHHAYVGPALECSLALLVALCLALVGGTLVKARILMHTAAERSTLELWPRLGLAQLALFAIMERAEGTHASVLGCLVELLVALGVAYVLALFSQLLVRCVAHTQAASRYVERRTNCVAIFMSRPPHCFASALAVRTGTARFQRPPPNR